MTMVPAAYYHNNLSKPTSSYHHHHQHILYSGVGCGGDVIMTAPSLPPEEAFVSYANTTNNNYANSTNIIDTSCTVPDVNTQVNNTTCLSSLGSDLLLGHNNNINMLPADQEEQYSRTSTSVNEAISSSSNKDRPDDDDDLDDHHNLNNHHGSWLQLGLSGTLPLTKIGTPPTPDPDHHHLHQNHVSHDEESTAQMAAGPSSSSGLMLELNLGGNSLQQQQQQPEFRAPSSRPVVASNLLKGASAATSCNLFGGFISNSTNIPPPALPTNNNNMFQVGGSEMGYWGLFRTVNDTIQPRMNMTSFLASASSGGGGSGGFTSCSSPSSSSSASLTPAAGHFLAHPFAGTGPSCLDLRVIDPPPRRPHAGIWFSLQASHHQSRQPSLPQVPKSFLRIKDGRMTVRVVMKYLANKLGLDSESQVEVRCRGQQLVPFLPLLHVRDNIWSSRESVTLLPDSSTTDNVMVLHYVRSTTSYML